MSKQQFTVVEPGQFKEEKPILTGYVGDLLAVRLVKAGWANKLDHIVTEMRERGLPGQFFFYSNCATVARNGGTQIGFPLWLSLFFSRVLPYPSVVQTKAMQSFAETGKRMLLVCLLLDSCHWACVCVRVSLAILSLRLLGFRGFLVFWVLSSPIQG